MVGVAWQWQWCEVAMGCDGGAGGGGCDGVRYGMIACNIGGTTLRAI
jgi:hypothetical protein